MAGAIVSPLLTDCIPQTIKAPQAGSGSSLVITSSGKACGTEKVNSLPNYVVD